MKINDVFDHRSIDVVEGNLIPCRVKLNSINVPSGRNNWWGYEVAIKPSQRKNYPLGNRARGYVFRVSNRTWNKLCKSPDFEGR